MTKTLFAAIFFTISLGAAGASVHDSFLRSPDSPSFIKRALELGTEQNSSNLSADTDIAPAARAEQPKSANVKPFRMPPISHYAVIVGRPLFSETRRPPKPPAPKPKKVAKAAPVPAPPPPLPPVRRGQFSLVGVVMDGSETYALVRHASKNELLRVTVGQVVDKWRIAEIKPSAVVVTQRDVKDLVLLHAKEETTQTAAIPNRKVIPNRRTQHLKNGLRRRNIQSKARGARSNPTSFVRSLRNGKKTKRVNAVKHFGLSAAVGKRRKGDRERRHPRFKNTSQQR